MRILGHIHTFNDEDVIERTLQALLDQTYPLREIIIVDNGSTDGTLQRTFPKHVTVIRNYMNLGTSGAAITGFQYALINEYDWIWILDGDSLPDSDALEKLVNLYESFDQETRRQIGVIGCSQAITSSSKLIQGHCFTPKGPRLPKIDLNLPYCEADSLMWTGSLFNLDAVQAVGFPLVGKGGFWDELSSDLGDSEFTFRIRRAGYKVFVHRFSRINHPLGEPKEVHIFGRTFLSTSYPPIRRYMFFRNLLYFWIYLFPGTNWPMFSVWFLHRFTKTTLGILFLEKNRASKIWACFKGSWDGIRKNMHGRC